MDQRGAIGLEQVVDAPEVGRILGAADVFEHANADDGVERALGVAVVLEPEYDLAVQSQFFDTSLGDCQLFARQRDAGDVCAVVLRKVDRTATPAAADVGHARAGLQENGKATCRGKG